MLNVSNDEREVENCYRSYIVTKPTTSYIVNSIICCIVNLILCFVGSFLNALVVYVFWKTPKLRYKISYFMIMVLSSIDVLVTLILHPAHLVVSIAEIIEKPRCVYKLCYHTAALLLSGMSFLTFFVLNVERYLSIVHPIFHLRHVTKGRCLIVCLMFWSLAVFGGPVAYPLKLNIQFLIAVLVVIIMVGTCYIYIVIFYVARKKRRGLNNSMRTEKERSNVFVVETSLRTDDTASPDNSSIILSSIENKDKDPECRRTLANQETSKHNKAGGELNKTVSFYHDLQLAKMYFLVVFVSFILNLPYAINAVLYDRPTAVNGVVQSRMWTDTLVHMNSTVNSVIFFWANERLRKEGRKVYKRVFKR